MLHCCQECFALNHDLSDPSLAPASFGPFRVLHQIGVGVLGPVYRAQDSVRDQLVAVKVFKVDAPPEQAEQIAEALRGVVQALPRHHGLVELVAAGVERDTAWLAMAHSDVLSLDSRLKPGVPLDAEEALGIIRTLADAMDAAHARGIVHGGLHPRDIFVDERGACRASGFGVATALARAGVKVPVRRPYSPPERLTSAPIEPPADRFALGAIAFELLSGRRVVGTGANAAGRCLLPAPGADLGKLQMALAAMLAEQPEHRPSSASAFAQALTLAVFPHGLTAAGERPSVPAAIVPGDQAPSGARDDTRNAASRGPATEQDGPTADDLERFTRQGTLWESKPRDESPRWETVESVALGQDPLALFAPESRVESTRSATAEAKTKTRVTPSPDGPVDRGEGGDEGDEIGTAGGDRMPESETVSLGAALPRTDVLGIGDVTADSRAASPDADGADDLGVAAHDRTADDDDLSLNPPPEEAAPSRPDSILGLSAIPAAGASTPERPAGATVAPGSHATDVASDTAAAASSSHEGADSTDPPSVASAAAAAVGVAAARLAREADAAARARVEVDEPAPVSFLRLDHDEIRETSAVTPRGPVRIDDDPPAELEAEEARETPAAVAAARHRGEPHHDEPSAGDRPEILDYTDHRGQSERRERREYQPASPYATPAAASAAAQGPRFAPPPEPADVGSSVRVVGLVLALGLAIGGAGGYLLGQRAALRNGSALDGALGTTGAGGAQDGAAADSAAGEQPPADSTAGSPGLDAGTAAVASREGRATAGAGSGSAAPARGAAGTAGAGAAAPGTGARAPTGRLIVRSSPARAEVAIDGVRKGVTPLTLRDLPLGAHTVRVTRSGYAPETRRVTLAASRPSESLIVELEPTTRVSRPRVAPPRPASQSGAAAEPAGPGSASGLGSIYVLSRPIGARVTIDGRVVGTTPMLATDIAPGARTIRLELKGHKTWTNIIQVTSGQRVRVAASLEEGS